MKNQIKLSNFTIGKNSRIFIVAEISANHNQDLNTAIKLIDQAKKCGANAVKFQHYLPETITIKSNKPDFQLNKNSNWSGKTYYDLYSKGFTPREWTEELFSYSYKLGLIPLSTPFSLNDLDFLESFNPEIYKIASYELIDLKLVEEVSKLKKPIILSIGGSTLEEIDITVETILNSGNDELILLNCLCSYPAPNNEINMKRLTFLEKKFNCIIGLSDHSKDYMQAVVAASLNAKVIEKHIKIEEEIKPLDDKFSSGYKEFDIYVKKIREVESILGKETFGPQNSELINLESRRSLFSSKNIKKGEVLKEEDLISFRPAIGLHPQKINNILGKKAKKNIDAFFPITEDLF